MNVSLSSILLFSLVTPFIMTFRLSPGETPYFLFGLIFLALLLYIILDLVHFDKSSYFKFKGILLFFIIVSSIGSAFFSAIVVRHRTSPVYMVHDIVLQQESAIQFLLRGKNPYEVTYFGTPLEEWHYSDTKKNPALYHFVMQPFYLLFALPFYFISMSFFGFFDGRIPLYFLFFTLIVLGYLIAKEKGQKLLFATFLAFNPATLAYILEGRSDVFMFAFLFISLFLLYHKKYMLAGIPMAFAFATKQSAWPILPLYGAFLYFQNRDIFLCVKRLSLLVGTYLLIILPFLLWNAQAFIDSTVLYLSGSTPNSYPISGYGWGMVLHQVGMIKDLYAYYPFVIWQIILCAPIFIFLVKFLGREPSVRRLVISYGIFLFIFWYFSRYFNNSHLAYLSTVFITAYFWPENETSS